jgi:F-type H+-transporting ATPase subunit a
MEQLVFTQFLNRVFGGFVATLFHRLGIPVANPAAPISNAFAMELLVVMLLTVFFALVRLRLSVEKPGSLQHTMEAIYGFVNNLAHETIGRHADPFVAYLTTLGMFILSCNLIGLVPGLESPTGISVVPLGCALLTFIYYNFYGIRTNGFIGYLKHFIGPQDKDIPIYVRIGLPVLMFPIEVCSHLARIMSLTIRLYANMFAGEMVTLVFFSLIPFGIPVVFEGLHIFVSLIQTYIFVLLACVYLGEATAHEH